MVIMVQMRIEEKGNIQAYKCDGSKSFGYTDNIIIIAKVKN